MMTNLDKLQRRSIDDTPNVTTNDKEQRIVSGYALKFNTLSCDLGGYIETISPSALDDEIINKSDIFFFINHDERLGVLARSRFGKGKLKLSIDDIGLRYEFKLSDSPVCNQLRQYLDDEIITKSSFSFTIAEGGYEWINNPDGSEYIDENGLQRLIIKRFDRLYDCSSVFEPAYQDTECSIRMANEIDDTIIQELNQRKNNVVIQRNTYLDNYYTSIRKKYRIRK